MLLSLARRQIARRTMYLVAPVFLVVLFEAGHAHRGVLNLYTR